MQTWSFGVSAILAASAAGLVVASCAEKVEGCEYTGTCTNAGGSAGSSATAGSSGSSGKAGAGATAQGGGAGNAGSGNAGAGNMTGGAGSGGRGDAGGRAGTGGDGGDSGGQTAGESGDGGDAGSAGSGGDGGDGGAPPCGGECGDTTPVCKPQTETCVECTLSSHCDGDTPVCETGSNTCVECSEDEHQSCTGDTSLCDPDQNLCVACLETTDCTEPSLSRCDSAHECTPCQDSDDCAHIPDKNVCDAGTCVECTLATETTACGANSCDPATKTCTDTARGSVGICLPCVTDSECIGGNQADPDQRCVPMQFQGVPRAGGFCLTRAARTCMQPYMTPIVSVSLSGAGSETYCGIAQSITRCEAVLDFVNSKACSDGEDTSCGCNRDDDGNCIETGLGGLCRPVGVNPNRCTYACGTLDHCPLGTTCSGIGTTYCQ